MLRKTAIALLAVCICWPGCANDGVGSRRRLVVVVVAAEATAAEAEGGMGGGHGGGFWRAAFGGWRLPWRRLLVAAASMAAWLAASAVAASADSVAAGWPANSVAVNFAAAANFVVVDSVDRDFGAPPLRRDRDFRRRRFGFGFGDYYDDYASCYPDGYGLLVWIWL